MRMVTGTAFSVGASVSAKPCRSLSRKSALRRSVSPFAVGRLCHIRDYNAAKHEFAGGPGGNVHQVELISESEASIGAGISPGSAPDSIQVEVQSIGLDELDQCRLYPMVLVPLLKERGGPARPA